MTDLRTRERPNIIGAVLGSYRITGELSSGGMGTVYRAQHELIGKPAAVKLLRPELTANGDLVQRFFNEAKAATAIRHPGIIEVFDFGFTDDGEAYLVMELLEGQTLTERIAERGRLAEIEAAQIARGIASALTAAHGKGIVHRDLKPDNVFLVPDPDMPGGERAKVLDFGIAKLADPAGAPDGPRKTATGALIGTPLYMAPEQARAAGEIDERADLYSLGCMLYEMLVGEPPFLAVGAGEIIALQLFGQPQKPSERVERISPALERIVLRLLEKEPADRFATAAALSEALQGELADAGLRVRVSGSIASAGARAPLATRPGASTSIPSIETLTAAPPARTSLMPILAGILTLAIAGGGIYALVRATGKPSEPVPQPAPVPPPAPAPPPAPSPPPEPTHDVVVTPPAPPPVVHQKPKAPAGKHTDKGSPIEVNP